MEQLRKKLGFCVICGDRVFSDETFIESSDGYCHHSCISETSVSA